MKLIVGLGNPREKYQNNRHNVGFMFADYINNGSNFKYDKYLLSEVSTTTINEEEIVLVKPQTFMNKSGQAVAKLIRNLPAGRQDWKPARRIGGLEIRNLVIAHDDLDIPLGKFKIQLGQGPKLHNGLLSIEQHLKTQDFWRIRIGVDNRPPDERINGEAYVLQDFTKNEKKIINDIFPIIAGRLTAIA